MRRLLVLAVLLPIAGCDRGHPWPEEVQAAFLKSCAAQAPQRACACTLDELRRRLSYEEFAALEARTRADGKPAPEFQDAAATCR